MKLLLSICLIAFAVQTTTAQTYKKEIIEFQDELAKNYKDAEKSPLTKKGRKKFKGFNFFSIDESYKVIAKFERAVDAEPFEMKTSGPRIPIYEVYGIASFTLEGKEYKLNVYQNHRLREIEEYKDYLFLPFTDFTNGEETYGGGRYIDIRIPEDEVLVIDFNKAYNPYCAYETKQTYSCPIPPKENDLDCAINAGIKMKMRTKKSKK